MEITIRKAAASDVTAMLALIRELAEYEKAPLEVTNTVDRMLQDGFGEKPSYFAQVAEVNVVVVGVALFYPAYSTWKGKYIYLDDIIVTQEFRGKGIGKRLFDAVGAFAKATDANLLRWHVLEWNEPALNFYRKYQAHLDPEWVTGKLTKADIIKLF